MFAELSTLDSTLEYSTDDDIYEYEDEKSVLANKHRLSYRFSNFATNDVQNRRAKILTILTPEAYSTTPEDSNKNLLPTSSATSVELLKKFIELYWNEFGENSLDSKLHEIFKLKLQAVEDEDDGEF